MMTQKEREDMMAKVKMIKMTPDEKQKQMVSMALEMAKKRKGK